MFVHVHSNSRLKQASFNTAHQKLTVLLHYFSFSFSFCLHLQQGLSFKDTTQLKILSRSLHLPLMTIDCLNTMRQEGCFSFQKLSDYWKKWCVHLPDNVKIWICQTLIFLMLYVRLQRNDRRVYKNYHVLQPLYHFSKVMSPQYEQGNDYSIQ